MIFEGLQIILFKSFFENRGKEVHVKDVPTY